MQPILSTAYCTYGFNPFFASFLFLIFIALVLLALARFAHLGLGGFSRMEV